MNKSTNGFVIASLAIVLAGCGGSSQMSTQVQQVQNSQQEMQAKEAIPEPEEMKNTTMTELMIGNDRRKAVFFEAFFALRRPWLNPPNESGPFGGNQYGGCVVGDWSYLASDTNALNYVTNRINRSNASLTNSDMASSAYDMKGGYERAGQCFFFTVLILRRSLSYDLPVNWSYYSPSGPSARNSQPGDVVYYRNYPYSGANHMGIVVGKNGDGMDVVDSNFVGYGNLPIKSGVSDSEVIGRHWVPNANIDKAGWKVYSGKGRWY